MLVLEAEHVSWCATPPRAISGHKYSFDGLFDALVDEPVEALSGTTLSDSILSKKSFYCRFNALDLNVIWRFMYIFIIFIIFSKGFL